MKWKTCLLIFIVTFSNSVAAKNEKAQDHWWLCGSDDDPRSVFANYPLRGAAKVQISMQNWLSEGEPYDLEDGRAAVRFNFDDYNQAFSVILGGRGKDAGNIFRAALYEFADLPEGEDAEPIDFYCLERTEQ
jgi:hypothetical protein